MKPTQTILLALFVANAPAPAETLFLDDFGSAPHNLIADLGTNPSTQCP